ncbi:hypothetical protein ACFQ3T_08540 [Saccharothrix hoggarensis]|uniref:Uncharacterized protein n=1 Tax=Saccharothrix hoggarensis TaxID=913853 RepID=A0ABW3QQQ8_9PSEU
MPIPRTSPIGTSSDSRSSPSGMPSSTGRSMPSANTAARPGGNDTTCRDRTSSSFMVAPTASRSSAAGIRSTIFSAVFFRTSGMILAGICSAITTPSP